MHLQRSVEIVRRSVLVAKSRAFPGVERALVAVGVGICLGFGKAVVAIVEHRLGKLGAEHEQGRIDPCLGIPEDVAVVAESRQAHRRHRQPRVLADKRIHVIDHVVHILLALGVAFDYDVAFPKVVPKVAVAFDKPSGCLHGGHESKTFHGVAYVMMCCLAQSGPDDVECIWMPFFKFYGEILRVVVIVACRGMADFRQRIAFVGHYYRRGSREDASCGSLRHGGAYIICVRRVFHLAEIFHGIFKRFVGRDDVFHIHRHVALGRYGHLG